MLPPSVPAATSSVAARQRLRVRSWLPSGAAGWVLAALVVVGIALRVLAAISWWPATTTLSDAISFAGYAEHDPLGSPQHPPGYALTLDVIGLFTREVAVTIAIQHLLGIGSALLTFSAVRRLCGSAWPGIAAAAIMLLDGDLIYLEQSVMSESTFVFVLSVALYACVRAIDEPDAVWGWPLVAGVALGLCVWMRAAGLFLVPVAIVVLILARPRPWRSGANWRGPATAALAAAVMLLGLAVSNKLANDRLEIGPAQGWHLYQRVAPFADCSQFTPPAGTEALCETTPRDQRLGGDHYLYDEDSPARQAFGAVGAEDAKLGAFARQVILHQPLDYARAMWNDLTAYWVPSGHPFVDGGGGDLDPQLDWEITLPPDSRFDTETKRFTEQGMEVFFDPFTVDQWAGGIRFLDTEQRLFRFGGTLLTITTALVLLGLAIGPRRSRLGVLLLGVGGLALLVAPTVSAIYIGRYTVPIAGPMVGAAAIAVFELWRMETARRRLARREVVA